MHTKSDLNKIARAIHNRKMNMPAIFMLEMYKPLSKLFSVFSVAISPIAIPLVGSKLASSLTELFDDRNNIEELICLLENEDFNGN